PHPAFGHPLPQWGRGQGEGVASGRKTRVSSLQPRRVLQGFNRLGLVCLRIEPGIVKLEKNPLRPFEIVRVGGVDLTCPIVAEPERLDLTLESGDILLRGLARVLAGLDGVLLGGQTKRVPAHRMEHVKTLGALVSRQNVRGGVAFGMPNMQPGPRRIREHVEDVIFRRKLFRAPGRSFKTVAPGEWVSPRNYVAWIPRAKGLLFLPDLLPFRLNQMKRILFATARHRGEVLEKATSQSKGRSQE